MQVIQSKQEQAWMKKTFAEEVRDTRTSSTEVSSQPKPWRQLREHRILVVFGYQQLPLTFSTAT